MSLGTGFKTVALRRSIEHIWGGDIASAVSLLPSDFNAMSEAEDLARRIEDIRLREDPSGEIEKVRDAARRTSELGRLLPAAERSDYPGLRVQAAAHYNGLQPDFETAVYPRHLYALSARFSDAQGGHITDAAEPFIKIGSELAQPTPEALGKLCVVRWAVEGLELPPATTDR